MNKALIFEKIAFFRFTYEIKSVKIYSDELRCPQNVFLRINAVCAGYAALTADGEFVFPLTNGAAFI